MKILHRAGFVGLAVGLAACQTRDTSRLTAAQETAFATEGVVHRAANVRFRYTHNGWEDRLASIIVTRQSVLIYKNEKVGLEITPASRRAYDVAREADRVKISAGTDGSKEVWSFIPPDSAAAWTESIRAVIKAVP